MNRYFLCLFIYTSLSNEPWLPTLERSALGRVKIAPWGWGCVNIRISIFHFQVSYTAPAAVAQIFKSPGLGDARLLAAVFY
jgi:hypothetical protein